MKLYHMSERFGAKIRRDVATVDSFEEAIPIMENDMRLHYIYYTSGGTYHLNKANYIGPQVICYTIPAEHPEPEVTVWTNYWFDRRVAGN